MAIEDEVDFAALVILVENNILEFEEFAGGEVEAQKTLDALKRLAGQS